MPKGDPWTVKEEQFIAANSGKMSVMEMSSQTGRSPHAIWTHWYEMKRQGKVKGTLYHWDGKRNVCCVCHTKRHFMRKGTCLICLKKDELEGTKERNAEAFRALSQKDKKTYLESESKTGPRKKVIPPKMPNVLGMTKRELIRAELDYSKALEAFEVQKLQREINRRKQQTKRMREKTGTNPRAGKNKDSQES